MDEKLSSALPMGKEQVRVAMETLRKYRAGKRMLESRIIEDEEYWKLNHWAQYEAGNPKDPRPVSGWLVNVVLNRHADAMAAYPEPNCLPRAADDVEEARRLSKILPVLLRLVNFRRTYSRVEYDKIKFGCGAYGVFWDSRALNGLGEISIRRMNLLNLFWEPGVEDIQESRQLFNVEEQDNEELEETYPQLKGKLAGGMVDVSRFRTEDNVDHTDKSLVVDWYYKRNGVLHYCKFCGDTVLFATENEPERYPRGWYDHGKFPFVFDVLYPEEGTPCGFGFIDIVRDPQKYVDLLNQAILKNTQASATPRFFIRSDGAVNEQEFADFTKPFIHTDGQLGQDSILPVKVSPLPATALNVLQMKINEMRETSGNTESATGVANASVTAASAIAALQEASGKLSRDMNVQTYDAFEQMVLLCIELIRQFYDMPRMFRITGEDGQEEFTAYDNAGLLPQSMGTEYGVDMGTRTPVFDIEVVAQNESRYTKAEYNQLAMNLYQAGFFNPELADQATACLEMMDFKGREKLLQRIGKNALLAQRLKEAQKMALALAQQIYTTTGDKSALDRVAALIQEETPAPAVAEDAAKSTRLDRGYADGQRQENAIVERARARSQEAAQVQ